MSLMCVYAQVLKHATLFFSQATPSLAQVIPAMGHIDTVFGTLKDNDQLHPAVRYAVTLGKATLNHYYKLMDWATVYQIMMGMYLSHFLWIVADKLQSSTRNTSLITLRSSSGRTTRLQTRVS